MPKGRLEGKAAVITGSARGIGRAIALLFASEGADLLVNDLAHPAEAEAVAEEIRSMGRRARVIIADAGDFDRAREIVDACAGEYGSVDIAVANAGYERHAAFLESKEEDVRRAVDVILLGAYALAFHAGRHMTARGEGGKIVFISSIHAVQSFPDAAAYNMCKAGINHLARSIANELACHHVNVNAIEPGWINTPGERTFYSEEELAAAGARLPWGRMGRPDDIARAALYLCSDDADYVTGSILRVDGGYTASLSLSLSDE